jgi:hypothetical protein
MTALGQVVRRLAAVEDHAGAGLAQPEGDGVADSSTSTCNNCNLIGKTHNKK